MIILRYLLKEVLRSCLGVLVVLLVVYVGHRFGRYLGQASVGSVPAEVLVELTTLKVVENLPLLLPLTLYLACLLALGRLYRDSEVIAMLAGGIGTTRIVQGLLSLALLFALLVGAVTLHYAPIVVNLQEDLMRRAYEQTPIAGLQPGRFRDMQQGEVVVYFEDLADDGRTFLNAFGQVVHEDQQDVFVADRAYQILEEVTQTPFLVLEGGDQYSGLPGQLDYSLTHFEVYARQLPRLETTDAYRKLRAVPTSVLLQSDRLDY
ncbi:MAG: LptF/LptG family permease, partial [Gammaproteobacteria bacterium]|nr:LptF/LptG family permease [Gammaproteobacteria bacterium]